MGKLTPYEIDQRQAKMRACRKSVHQIANAVNRGSITTVEQLEKEFETITDIIAEMRPELIAKLNTIKGCTHEKYLAPTYTFQRRVIGHVFVYKRICADCGKPEIHTCKDPSEAPSWARDATEVYYNNGI